MVRTAGTAGINASGCRNGNGKPIGGDPPNVIAATAADGQRSQKLRLSQRGWSTMSRTYRNRPAGVFHLVGNWRDTADWRWCWCCSRKAQRKAEEQPRDRNFWEYAD